MTELLDDLVLRFPARPGYLSICRLNATTMAAGAGFDIEELDDLRLAIDEAVNWLIPEDATELGSIDGSVELTIACGPGRFDVTGVRTGGAGGDVELDDLVHAILGATVDRYEISGDGATRSIHLVKQRPVDG